MTAGVNQQLCARVKSAYVCMCVCARIGMYRREREGERTRLRYTLITMVRYENNGRKNDKIPKDPTYQQEAL